MKNKTWIEWGDAYFYMGRFQFIDENWLDFAKRRQREHTRLRKAVGLPGKWTRSIVLREIQRSLREGK